MNLYAFLMMYSFSFTSMFASPSRVESAKKRYRDEANKKIMIKEVNKHPDEPQIRKPRHGHRSRVIVLRPIIEQTTTTTKSPLQLLREKEAQEQKRNPKGIESPIQKEIRIFSDELKRLEKQCKNNSQCDKGSCCMTEAGPAYCMKMPGHYERCSELLCPCHGKMECKVKKEINEKGQSTYNKQCMKTTEPESADITGMEKMGVAKERLGLGKGKVPSDKKASTI